MKPSCNYRGCITLKLGGGGLGKKKEFTLPFPYDPFFGGNQIVFERKTSDVLKFVIYFTAMKQEFKE